MQSWKVEGKWKWAKFKPLEEGEYPPRLGQEGAGGPAKEQVFPGVASQRDANNTGKQLAQKD